MSARAAFASTDAWAALAAARASIPRRSMIPGCAAPEAGEAASIVARIPQVRAALLAYQRAFAAQPGGAVLDGRDIGTVVCAASRREDLRDGRHQVRARRRFLERQARSEAVTFDAVLADIERRDARDACRGSAPMRPAPDADLLETSDLDIEAAFEAAVGLIKRKIGQ